MKRLPDGVPKQEVARSVKSGIAWARSEVSGDAMMRTVEGVINEDGTVRLLKDVPVTSSTRRALVIILEEQPAVYPHETALLSEAALAEDWNRAEEDAAWAYLQSGT